ncbi:FtsH protease activity modulator HflK [uncultured Sphingomonas sp.]|uniref:FtsH protease activity modulator HflK n=1 Tax=uncultured Sphingomonas sp. TaxID=158754 RepID=UPI0035CBEBFA
MTSYSGGPRPPRVQRIDTPKSPWGDGGGGGGGSDGNGGGGGGSGPRNPWSVPPGGRKPPQRPTALDEFLRKARNAGTGGGGGFGGLPGGANAAALWKIGAGLIVLLWLLLTSIHAIGPQQRGVVTYFGRYAGTLEPGYRPTLPAPIAAVTVVDVKSNRLEDFPESGGENLVLTGDQNIVDLSYSVRWTIANPRDYVFQIANPRDTVRASAESSMREVLANVTLDQALTNGRALIEAQVRERMQRILDDYHSGISVSGVALKQVIPPQRVNEAFKDVTAAQQDAQAARNQAQSYAQQKIALAQGQAGEFDRIYAQYKLAPEVTRKRLYYETMEAVLAKSDKTLVEAPGVMPYLPLDKARRAPEPEAPAGAQP